MARIISVHSFRRGAGKSTLTANAATLLAMQGASVGIVDMDLAAPSQQILFGLTDADIRYTFNDFLWGNCEIEQTAVDLTPRLRLAADVKGNAYLVPASTNLTEIERVLRGDYYIHLLHDGFDRLIETLGLSVLLIDTHAGLSEETLLAFGISDVVTILLRHDQRDYQGTAVTVDVVRRLEIPRITLIVNETPGNFDLANVETQVASTYGCEVVGMLSYSQEIAALASRGIFALRYPQHPVTVALRDIAANLAA